MIGKFNAAFLQLILAVLKNGNLLGAAQIRSLHPALVGGCNIRHKYGAVPYYLTIAGQPPAGLKFFLTDVAGLDGLHLALHQLHPAFAAGAVTGAGSIDGHIGTTGKLQQIIPNIAFHCDFRRAFNLENYFCHRKILTFP